MNSLEETAMPLETEMKTYREKLAELREHEGKFVLIHGTEVVDFFSTYDDAIKEGYQQFGVTPFLVKRVEAAEQMLFISRFVDPLVSCAPQADACPTSH